MRIAETVFFVALALVVVGLPTTLIYKAIEADGKVDYCYIRENSMEHGNRYILWGNVDWRADDRISSWNTADEAQNAATKINCEIRP